MENAAKALLIAAEVLIGVLVLSLAVYLFISFSQRYAEINKLKQEQDLVEFNSTYTRYSNRTDLTIYDITTIISNAKQNNNNYIDEDGNINSGEEDNIIEITIDYKGAAGKKAISKEGSTLKQIEKAEIDEIIKADQSEITLIEEVPQMPKYTCKEINYNENQRVNELIFEKN